MPDKTTSAEALIRWHFEVEPGLEVVYRAMAANEDDPSEPIKLLEVNEDAVQTREFPAFGFPPTTDFPFQTIIAEVTSESLERLQVEGKIPAVWDLHRAKRYLRQAA
jgi:hypothetical protein